MTKLPQELRERYEEEWESEVHEYPGEFAKLLFSVGLIRASVKITSELDCLAEVSPYKRPFDLLMSGFLILVIFPMFGCIAAAVALETRGPVLVGYRRLGRHGKAFRLLKFRTFSGNHEGRTTRVGRFLRRFSLDELPELLNVLRGDMSLVGPPPLRSVKDDHVLLRQPRSAMAPGISGLWTLQLLKGVSVADCESLEDFYAKNQSMMLDMSILLRTILFTSTKYDASIS